MKSTEQLVAGIRELRFAIDRLSADELGEELSPTTRQALIAQARALHADLDRLLEDMGEVSQADAFERDLANSY
jgi:hypothetical protein